MIEIGESLIFDKDEISSIWDKLLRNYILRNYKINSFNYWFNDYKSESVRLRF